MADFRLSKRERLSGVVAIRSQIYMTNDGGWFWAVGHPASRWSSSGVATSAGECCQAISDQLTDLLTAEEPVAGVSALLDLDARGS
jgi:hypothetical protein